MIWMLYSTFVFAEPAIVRAEIHKSEATFERSKKPSKYHRVTWPFYSSHTINYFSTNPHWIELEIDISVYQKRRNDPHESFADIVKTSQEDLLPLTKAFERYFIAEGITSTTVQAGHILGLIQGIEYAFDSCDNRGDCDVSKTTGWTEYPKYSIEMFVDQVGDCDDAAISVSSLLTNMNLPTYILFWESKNKKQGHLSVATERIGDLKNAKIPTNSSFIILPQESKKLIHFEATEGSKPLGYNEFSQDLYIQKFASTKSESELQALNLQTWSEVKSARYRERNREDRRGASREEIEEELQLREDNWEEENTKRLEKLGVEEERQKEIIKNLTKSKNENNDMVVLGIVLSLVSVVGGLWFRHNQREKYKIQQAKERVKNETSEQF